MVNQSLAVPKQFVRQALAIPDQIDRLLSTISSSDGAIDALDKMETMASFARRIKTDTSVINAIQYGKIKLVAKLAEMMPREKGGRGKKTPLPTT